MAFKMSTGMKGLLLKKKKMDSMKDGVKPGTLAQNVEKFPATAGTLPKNLAGMKRRRLGLAPKIAGTLQKNLAGMKRRKARLAPPSVK